MKPFKMGGISFVPELWKPEDNLGKLLAYINDAAKQGAEVIATPEGILDGYLPRARKEYQILDSDRNTEGYEERKEEFQKRAIALARRIKEDAMPRLLEKAERHSIYLFAATLDIRDDEVFNTSYVIDPNGRVVTTYDKVHVAFEMAYSHGSHLTVVETPFAPIGVVICADRQYPEAVRATVLAGARVLIVNSYGMWGEGINERIIRQRAYENGCYLFFCHPKETVLVSPEGRIMASSCGWEPVLVRSLDPREAVGRGLFENSTIARTYVVSESNAAYDKRFQEIVERRERSFG
jgi:predicted amidohydrolase